MWSPTVVVGTNWAALWLTLQIGQDAVLSKSYGHG